MSLPLKLSFHGAARVVTGSKHLLRCGDTRVLLDAGLFQGRKKLRLMNWDGPGFDPRSIDRVMISHSHIDHIGYLPRLVKNGLRAPVHLTPAAYELAELMLRDSARIQEEDARYANKKGFSKHHPALPLYDSKDVEAALELREKTPYNRWVELDDRGRLRGRFVNAGHILGAAFIELEARPDEDTRSKPVRIVYSGDLGRFDMPLHQDPRPLPSCDVLVLESTYGNRNHADVSAREQLAEALRPTLRDGGTVLIPAFAVGRSQQITLLLRRLMKAGELPEVPIHIDSPMAVNATRIYSRFLDRRNIDPDVFEDGRLRMFPREVHFHRSVEESMRLNNLPGPRVIVSSSGMLSGGRVLHHLKRLAPDARNLLVLVGYQGYGTRGRRIQEGADTVRIHGRDVPMRARFELIHGLSGHADADDLIRWVRSAPRRPRDVFVVHGEEDAAEALGKRLAELGIRVHVPELGEEFDLNALR